MFWSNLANSGYFSQIYALVYVLLQAEVMSYFTKVDKYHICWYVWSQYLIAGRISHHEQLEGSIYVTGPIAKGIFCTNEKPHEAIFAPWG